MLDSSPVPPSGTVHWIGAGLSTGSGLAALCGAADRVRLWHRTDERAGQSLAALGLTGRARPRAYTPGALTAELAPGDVVVSMLPAPESPRPWEATRSHVVDGESFEVYPNRDSVPFVGQYGLPPAWKPQTFVRGTLRLDGWLEAWQPVFARLADADAGASAIAELAHDLAARYPTTDADRDRVVLALTLDVRAGSGRTWSGRYLLDLVGDAEESAMARCVSRTLSAGVRAILRGTLPPGLNRAAETPGRAEEWLTELAGDGIDFRLTTDA
jgi:hypothetical protein